jgi:hypothetical protein
MFPLRISTGENSYFEFKDWNHAEQTMKDFMKCISLLEEIGIFDKGKSGDMACSLLKEINVWSKSVERVN